MRNSAKKNSVVAMPTAKTGVTTASRMQNNPGLKTVAQPPIKTGLKMAQPVATARPQRRSSLNVRGTLKGSTKYCVLFAMILLALMSYIIVNHPEIETQYPAIFWIARVYVNAVEVLESLVKLVLQTVLQLVNTIFKGTGVNLAGNWKAFVEAISNFWNFIVL